MFSGIVRGVGRILDLSDTSADRTLTIGLPPQPIGRAADRRQHRGQRRMPHGDRMRRRSFLGRRIGRDARRHDARPLERGCERESGNPLRMGDPLDGHIVTGHVDGSRRGGCAVPARALDCS